MVKHTDVFLFSPLTKQADRFPLFTGPGSPPRSVTERLGVRGRIILNDYIDVDKIDPSRGYIGTKEDCRQQMGRGMGDKAVECRFPDPGWEVAVEGSEGHFTHLSNLRQHLPNVILPELYLTTATDMSSLGRSSRPGLR